MKLQFPRQIFEECPNIKFIKIGPVRTEMFHAY